MVVCVHALRYAVCTPSMATGVCLMSEQSCAMSDHVVGLLQGPDGYTFWDVFFWRDAPDWYRKTFLATGFGLTFFTLKQYMNRWGLRRAA